MLKLHFLHSGRKKMIWLWIPKFRLAGPNSSVNASSNFSNLGLRGGSPKIRATCSRCGVGLRLLSGVVPSLAPLVANDGLPLSYMLYFVNSVTQVATRCVAPVQHCSRHPRRRVADV